MPFDIYGNWVAGYEPDPRFTPAEPADPFEGLRANATGSAAAPGLVAPGGQFRARLRPSEQAGAGGTRAMRRSAPDPFAPEYTADPVGYGSFETPGSPEESGSGTLISEIMGSPAAGLPMRPADAAGVMRSHAFADEAQPGRYQSKQSFLRPLQQLGATTPSGAGRSRADLEGIGRTQDILDAVYGRERTHEDVVNQDILAKRRSAELESLLRPGEGGLPTEQVLGESGGQQFGFGEREFVPRGAGGGPRQPSPEAMWGQYTDEQIFYRTEIRRAEAALRAAEDVGDQATTAAAQERLDALMDEQEVSRERFFGLLEGMNPSASYGELFKGREERGGLGI